MNSRRFALALGTILVVSCAGDRTQHGAHHEVDAGAQAGSHAGVTNNAAGAFAESGGAGGGAGSYGTSGGSAGRAGAEGIGGSPLPHSGVVGSGASAGALGNAGAGGAALENGCTATLEPSPRAPAVAQATVTCSSPTAAMHVAPAKDGAGYLSVTTNASNLKSYWFSLPKFASAGTPEPWTLDTAALWTLSGPGAEAYGIADDDSAEVFYIASEQGLKPEPFATPPTGTFYVVSSADCATNGTCYVLFGASGEAAKFAKRSASGEWTRQVITGSRSEHATLALDPQGVPRVFFWAAASDDTLVVREGLELGASTLVDESSANFSGALRAAAAGPEQALVAIETALGVTLRVQTSTGFNALPLDSSWRRPAPCHANPAFRCSDCSDYFESMGTSLAFDVAATADGSLWVAYTHELIDRDWSSVRLDEFGWCEPKIVAERSRFEVVLARVPANGTSTPETKWHIDLPISDTDAAIDLAARGQRIYLAVKYGAESDSARIQYVALDADKL